MAIVVPNPQLVTGNYVGGEAALLRYIVGKEIPDNPVMKLFSNDHTPSDLSTISNFTESSTTGYAAFTLVGTNWWITCTEAGVTSALYSEHTFTFSTNATVYGYYITDTSGRLLWCERFSTVAFVIPEGGGSITIAPKISLS